MDSGADGEGEGAGGTGSDAVAIGSRLADARAPDDPAVDAEHAVSDRATTTITDTSRAIT
jgi:hypothetical protein